MPSRPCKLIVECAACTMTLVLATLGLPSAPSPQEDAAQPMNNGSSSSSSNGVSGTGFNNGGGYEAQDY